MKKILARILICVMVLGLVQIGNTAGTAKAASTDADIYYAVHCQTYGWGLGVAKNGEVTGTSGQAKRLESIKIWVKSELSGSVEYETHVQTYGWSIGTKKDSEECGTTGAIVDADYFLFHDRVLVRFPWSNDVKMKK